MDSNRFGSNAPMGKTLPDHFAEIEDPRIPGMVTFPLTEILLVVFIGQLCRIEDFDEIEYFAAQELDRLRTHPPLSAALPPPRHCAGRFRV
jgi:hypothetical protein